MNKCFSLTALLLLLGLSTITAEEPSFNRIASSDNAVHITIIYDNYQVDEKLDTDWGFACLVEYQENQLLFDAGRLADLYKKNVALLDIDPTTIPTLFISHEHGDHTAGLPWITQVNPSLTCYLPSPYEKQLKASGKLPKNSQAVSEPMHLYGPFYSTGDNFEGFREHGLVVKTENGGVLITGCGHPGIVEMVARAQNELGIKVHAVIGGLHLMQTPGDEIKRISDELKKMGIEKICPTHCTGETSIARLKGEFKEGYIAGGTGKEISIN